MTILGVDSAVVLVLGIVSGFAALLGFWLGRTQKAPAGKAIPQVYIQGLNYLLSERQDEAVEVFLEALRQHPESVDILLALGRQFRRRGELERALRVHQYLLEQPTLAEELRQSVLFEIARDYLKAGILDRAESILKELLESQPAHTEGLATLAELYELGSEWASSIAIRKRLLQSGMSEQQKVIALLYGELAEEALRSGDQSQAQKYLNAARQEVPDNPRALMIAGRLAFDKKDWQGALKYWDKLLALPADSAILLVLEPFLQVLQHLGGQQQDHLQRLQDHCRSPLAIKRLAEALQKIEGQAAASSFLRNILIKKPDLRVFQLLLSMDPNAPETELIEKMALAVRQWQLEPELFHCQSCGYQSTQYYWRCPSCRQWGVFSGEEKL
ncbi:tetratricopeptide repeat protein [Acidithiobacillus thiooxidans]|uniref:tetratricopeptide repeat protein n=1 Tax=Acidithiobacillus thiooxidans TaxID=930 RepID=UPI001C06DA03|nr:tetratricopeptide repeat protein [Acidithiobacillus thiooxidans]MBU2838655.1 tetratricopeptide repeat protein [Acidithiobacillus thiooxidans]